MNVRLTPELEKIVQAGIQSGKYDSPAEMIREALHVLQQNDKSRAAHIEELRSHIDEGLAALDEDRGGDGEGFMQKTLDELDPRKTELKAG